MYDFMLGHVIARDFEFQLLSIRVGRNRNSNISRTHLRKYHGHLTAHFTIT